MAGMTDTQKRALLRQLRRVAIERRPECCLGCGFEHSCSVRGCAVIRQAEEIIRRVENGQECETESGAEGAPG